MCFVVNLIFNVVSISLIVGFYDGCFIFFCFVIVLVMNYFIVENNYGSNCYKINVGLDFDMGCLLNFFGF